MTSQQWLTSSDVSRSLWWHILVVIIPDNVDWAQNATLWITGWSNDSNMPTNKDEDIILSAALAMGTGTITGALFQIPNEHILFYDDPKQQSRGEDAIIAYTWDHFLQYPDQPQWLVRLPMVKASLRAMDTITEYILKTHGDLGCQLDYYIVAGASKRGWTTWLMGAVDPERVMAIVPIVLDAVNFVTVMHHQFQSYGGWSFALEDYYDMNLTARFDDANMLTLQKIEDPFFYFDRLTMPKLVVNAVGDEFQQPDDTHYWWNDLPEPKHFLIVPNAEHSLATGILEVVPAVGTWMSHLLKRKTVPTFKWEISNSTGDITVQLDLSVGKPLHVNMWTSLTCESCKRRDYRVMNIDNPCDCGVMVDGSCIVTKHLWSQTKLEPLHKGGSMYVAHVDPPTTKDRWVALFVDITYRLDDDETLGRPNGGLPFDKPGHLEFTSEVSIFPNFFPFDDCHGSSCYGDLV